MQSVNSRQRLMILFITVLCLTGLWTSIDHNSVVAAASAQATAAPTAAPTDAPTAVPTAAAEIPQIPTVNWNDVAIYKNAMKAGFERDVDKFVDSNRYLITATLTLTADATINGAERVRYTNHTGEALKDIVFRLYPNAPILDGKMTVTNVMINNVAVSPALTLENSVMTLPLSTPLAPGQSAEIAMGFKTVMIGGLDVSYGRFGYKEGVVSGTAWYPTLSVYDKITGWWKSEPDPKGDPAYSETGLYDVRFTMPADLTVVMSGKEIESTTNADGTVTHHDVTGPMRDHAFMASTRYTIKPLDVDGTRINVVHYKGDESATPEAGVSEPDGTANVVQFAGNSVKTYDRIFGQYPFAELNVVENPTPSGVEFPGVVQISEKSWFADQAFLGIVVSHEIGHQWFYSLVGNNQVEHPWLDESLASYLEIVYTREVYKDDSLTKSYIQNFQQRCLQYTLSIGHDVSLDLPVSKYSDQGYGSIVYGKGPVFYVRLENELGIPTVYKALNTYFNRYKYGVATTANVEKTFEEVSGKDLSTLFNRWIGGTGTPKDCANLTGDPALPTQSPGITA